MKKYETTKCVYVIKKGANYVFVDSTDIISKYTIPTLFNHHHNQPIKCAYNRFPNDIKELLTLLLQL